VRSTTSRNYQRRLLLMPPEVMQDMSRSEGNDSLLADWLHNHPTG